MNCRHSILRFCQYRLSCVKCCNQLGVTGLHQRRENASQAKKEKQEKIKIKVEPPKDMKNDWIGPPDSTSNIRTIRLYVPPDETPLEKSYRERREEVWKWNQEFWENHNKFFFKQKEEFTQASLVKKKAEHTGEEEPPQTLSPVELSVFYKRFLNDNFKSHISYNREWYKKNISLLWPAMQINISRFFRRRKPVPKS